MIITSENFQQQVLQAQQPVLLDFWAVWCGPCQMLSPVLEAVEPDFPQVCFGKVNVDEQPELAAQFGIQSIPTLVLMKNGQVAAATVGYQEEEDLRRWIGENL